MGENIYLFMIIALAVLAITDLIVGVSNDAVNFLNSAIGSKAISFKTIMIVASVGIAFGAISSSGMMEVARKHEEITAVLQDLELKVRANETIVQAMRAFNKIRKYASDAVGFEPSLKP